MIATSRSPPTSNEATFATNARMNDSQIVIPPSFVQIFVSEGRLKPTERREVIAARYDLCEDLAQMLTETARTKFFELGVTEIDVLERIHNGLAVDPSLVSAQEVLWVVRRLAELLAWPLPEAWRLPDQAVPARGT